MTAVAAVQHSCGATRICQSNLKAVWTVVQAPRGLRKMYLRCSLHNCFPLLGRNIVCHLSSIPPASHDDVTSLSAGRSSTSPHCLVLRT